MDFIKAVILAILTGLILPLAKQYIEQNYLSTPDVYTIYHDGGKTTGAPANR